MPSMIRRHAFTLLELLVTIAIIAALAGMLMPAMSMIKASANSSKCQSQLHQLGLAIGSYANDNESTYPAGSWTANGYSGIDVSWDDQLGYNGYDGRVLTKGEYDWGYMTRGPKATDFKYFTQYVCPADEAAKKGPIISGAPSASNWQISYGPTGSKANPPSAAGSSGVWCGRASGTPSGISEWTATTAIIRRPAEKILLFEMRDATNALGRSGQGHSQPQYQVNSTYAQSYYGMATPTPNHRSKWNYLFCDGHVQTLLPTETVTGGNLASSTSMWDRDS